MELERFGLDMPVQYYAMHFLEFSKEISEDFWNEKLEKIESGEATEREARLFSYVADTKFWETPYEHKLVRAFKPLLEEGLEVLDMLLSMAFKAGHENVFRLLLGSRTLNSKTRRALKDLETRANKPIADLPADIIYLSLTHPVIEEAA